MKETEARRGGVKPPPGASNRGRELLNEAVAHHQAGRIEIAESIYRKLLRKEPRNPDALHLSGVIALQSDRYEEALELISQAIEEIPTVALYHRNIGLTLEALDRADEAISHLTKTTELEPANSENHLRLGHAFNRAECPADAASSFQRAINISPQDAETHTSLAVALMNIGDTQGAGRNFFLARELAPDAAFTHANLGRFHADLDDPNAAEPPLRRALEIDPDFYEALVELGALMKKLYRLEEALVLLDRACALRPDSIRARSERVAALRNAGQLQRAHDEIIAIVRENPREYKAYMDLALVLSRMDRFDEAILALDKSLDLNPEGDEAYSNRSLLRLAQGDFAGGWKDYLHRDVTDEMSESLDRDILPEDLSDKRVALYRDQGLGDEIFFLRFASELKKRGAHITYNPDPKIAGMIGRLEFIDNIVSDDWPADGFDLRCSLGDLPFLLSIASASSLPPPLGLPVLAARDDEITAFLKTIGPPPYIGFTWRAGVQYRDRLSKMSPQVAMAETLKPLNGTILILQRNPRGDEIEDIRSILGDRLIDASRFNEDLEGMLALLGRIDEYVCVSNTNTHLRAARGLTSRVLIPLPADYRWMQSGDESPWFPGTPLYRETADIGWDTAFEQLSRDLSQAVGTP